jgi:hypothetical protein
MQWLKEEFGEYAVEVAQRFIDDPELHPYEERELLLRKIRKS